MTTESTIDYSQVWAALVQCQRTLHAAYVQQSNAITSSGDAWRDARMRVVESKAQLRKHEKRAAMGASAPAPHATDLELYERAAQERTEGETVGAAMFRLATSAKPATQVERPNPATVTHNASTLADARMKDGRIRDLKRQIAEREAQAGVKPWASMSEGERSRWVSQAVYEAATRREQNAIAATTAPTPSMPAWASLSNDERGKWIDERVYDAVRNRCA